MSVDSYTKKVMVLSDGEVTIYDGPQSQEYFDLNVAVYSYGKFTGSISLYLGSELLEEKNYSDQQVNYRCDVSQKAGLEIFPPTFRPANLGVINEGCKCYVVIKNEGDDTVVFDCSFMRKYK